VEFAGTRSVPPTVFNPQRPERCGLIIPLGDLVLKKVCAQILELGETGHDFGRIAVNLSPFHLSRPDSSRPSSSRPSGPIDQPPRGWNSRSPRTGLMENEGEGIERINHSRSSGSSFLLTISEPATPT
jgi:hypothetical protein